MSLEVELGLPLSCCPVNCAAGNYTRSGKFTDAWAGNWNFKAALKTIMDREKHQEDEQRLENILAAMAEEEILHQFGLDKDSRIASAKAAAAATVAAATAESVAATAAAL